jgi:hybrid cluster-associated redox disulfide protein
VPETATAHFVSSASFSTKGRFAELFVAAQRGIRAGAYAGSMERIAPTPDMMVDQVRSRWPATIRVFLDFKMGCVGCPIAAFHSVDDAWAEHLVDAAAFLRALQAVAA